jgi:hypothetical protein
MKLPVILVTDFVTGQMRGGDKQGAVTKRREESETMRHNHDNGPKPSVTFCEC